MKLESQHGDLLRINGVNIMKKISVLLLMLATLLLGACGGSSKIIKVDDPEGQPIPTIYKDYVEKDTSQIEKGVEIIGATQQQGLSGKALTGEILSAEEELAKQQREMLAQGFQPVIYFEYDQAILSQEAHKTIKHYADYLNNNLNENLTLVGHTDARGTPAYNLALGERRAKAVQEVFMLYGVNMSRIEVISMGEEMPAVDLQTEAAWAKNRRVEINIYE